MSLHSRDHRDCGETHGHHSETQDLDRLAPDPIHHRGGDEIAGNRGDRPSGGGTVDGFSFASQ
jgi:hypothetical protein